MARYSTVGVELIVDGLSSFERSLDMVDNSIMDVADAVNSMATQVSNDMYDMTQAIVTQMDKTARAVDDDAGEAVKNLGTDFDNTGRKTVSFKDKLSNIVNTASNVVNAVTNVTRFIIDMGKALFNAARRAAEFVYNIGNKVVTAAVDFESSFAGVRKTVDTTEEEFLKLQDSFRELSKTTPVDVNTINEIAELGGQLGVVNEDTEDVTGTLTAFAETIAALGVSTNLTTEAAATELSRFANIMGTTAEYGAETYSRLGSTIVDLGNKFATTESDISNFGARIAGAGKIAGLSEADVFAIGAAMSSVGVQAEAGGTAVQKVLLSMNEAVLAGGDNLEIFAATAGMSSEDFATAWEDNAGAAFTDFVEGLGVLGDDALTVLDVLGLKDQRLIRSFLSLANAGDLLDNAMSTANTAFEENTALMTEAEKRYATTESQIQIMKNRFNDVAITVGSALLPIINDILVTMTPIVEQISTWLENNLPTAIEYMTNVWNEKLVPAFESAKAFVLDTLLPAFNNLVSFFQTEGPGAIEKLQEVWGTVWGVIQEKAGIFITWFQENLPLIKETGETLVNFWQNNIVPTLDNIWAILSGVFDMFLGNILTSAELIMNLINGNWEEAWENVKEVFVNVWEGIKTVATNFFEGVLNFFGSNTEEFITQWSANWELVKMIVSQVWENIKTFFITTWENIVTAVTTAWENIKTGIAEFLEGIKTAITEKLEAIKEFWTGIWEGIKGIVSEKIQAVKDKINEILTSLFEKMGLDLDSMKERWSTILADLQAIAAEIWDRIKSAIIERLTIMATSLAELWDIISTKASEIWETISTKLGEVWDTISTKVTEIWDAISTKISEVWDTVSTYVGEKIDAIATKLGEVWDSISAKVTEIWDAIVLAVTGKAQEIYDTVTGKIEEIKTWFGEQVENFKTFGGDLIQGFIDGVTSKAGELISSVTGAVEDAIAGAKKLLGIESPSKVFEGIGVNTMLGFEKGIAEMIPQNQAVMGAAVSPSVSAPSVMPSQNISVQVGPNTIGSQIEQAVFEERVLQVVTGALP